MVLHWLNHLGRTSILLNDRIEPYMTIAYMLVIWLGEKLESFKLALAMVSQIRSKDVLMIKFLT